MYDQFEMSKVILIYVKLICYSLFLYKTCKYKSYSLTSKDYFQSFNVSESHTCLTPHYVICYVFFILPFFLQAQSSPLARKLDKCMKRVRQLKSRITGNKPKTATSPNVNGKIRGIYD